MIRIWLFDLDGTISDTKHREHYVRGKKKNFNAFYNACDKDGVLPGLYLFEHLYNSWDDVYIVTGRIDTQREKTLDWLLKHTRIDKARRSHLSSVLRMRPAAEPMVPDQILKKRFMEEIKASYGDEEIEIMGVFDDRNKVVKMWQENGLFVFNCNQTGEEF